MSNDLWEDIARRSIQSNRYERRDVPKTKRDRFSKWYMLKRRLMIGKFFPTWKFAFWYVLHNCVGHPLLTLQLIAKWEWIVSLHDYTYSKMKE